MNFQKISFDIFIPTYAVVSEMTFCCIANIFLFDTRDPGADKRNDDSGKH